jgi:hypothetical protein
VQQGLINEYDAEKRIYDLRQQALPGLREQVQKIVELSEGFDPATPQAEAARDAQNLLKDLNALQSPLQKLEAQTRETAANGFGQMFSDIVSGAKTAKEAFRDLVGNIAKYVLDIVAKRLGQKLAESLIPSGSFGGGGFGGFLGNVFSLFGFHSGGLVQAGGQTFTRALPLALAATMATAAPRYHSGGIAGFAPNEVPAVLLRGEEVLTEDDPRHIKNYRAGGNGVMVNSKVVINGAKGDAQKQERAGNDLQQQINTVIDQWALREKRPGGLLAN